MDRNKNVKGIFLYIQWLKITEYIDPPGDAHSHEDVDAASAAVLGADGDN